MKAVALEWNDNESGTYSYAASDFIGENGGTYTIWSEEGKFYLIGGAGFNFPPGVNTIDEAKAQAEELNQTRAKLFFERNYEV